jgi:succinoglycan biosynthesis transport protein ExoP
MEAILQQPAPDTREVLLSYWRGRKTFWIVAGASMLITVLTVILWPPTFRSTATILIEQQEIPQELVRSVITSFADQRVQVISQRVMTTQNLLSLVERYNLYPDIRKREPREVIIKKMHEDIGMRMISADVMDPRTGRPTQANIAFSVSYESRSPDLALKVANDLTSLYLNENITSRTKLSEQTASFFGEEAARQQSRIAELDRKLSDFKQVHHDELPELTQLNIQQADRTELELRDAENKIAALDQQRVLLQAQLATISPNAQVYSDTGQRVFGPEDRLKALKSQLAGLTGKYGPEHPDVITTQREIEGMQREVDAENGTADRLRQLNEAKSELADAEKKYSPEHPDVIRLKRIIESLEKAVQEDANTGVGQAARSHPDSPAYLQVKGALDAATVDKEAAVKRRDSLRAKYDSYESRMSKSPDVERQYREMTRDLDSAQFKYQEILSKQTETQVSEKLESERKGEKFTLIEPPQPPEKPVSPNRILILCIGIVLSFGLGVGAIMARETIDASVRGPGDIRQLLEVPALAAIPVIVTASDRLRRRRIALYSWGGSVSAFILGVLAVHFFYMPLDVLWSVLMRRMGI